MDGNMKNKIKNKDFEEFEKNTLNDNSLNLKSHHINTNDVYIGNIKFKINEEYHTFKYIFKYLDIDDIYNFIISNRFMSKFIFDEDTKVNINFDVILRIKKYIMNIDINNISNNDQSLLECSTFFKYKIRNFNKRTKKYGNINYRLINERSIYNTETDIEDYIESCANKLILNETIIGSDNNVRYVINDDLDNFIEKFYHQTKKKFKLVTPIINGIIKNDEILVRNILSTKLVRMNIMVSPDIFNNYLNSINNSIINLIRDQEFLNQLNFDDLIQQYYYDNFNIGKPYNNLSNKEIDLIYIKKIYNLLIDERKYNRYFYNKLKDIFSKCIDIRINHSIDVNELDDIRREVIHESLIPNLINKYIYINDSNLPIHEAAVQGNCKIMRILLNYPQTKVNVYNFIKQTALYLSILNGNTEVGLLLLQQKNINVNGFKFQENASVCKNSPIIIAIKNNNVLIVEELLKNKKILLNIVEDGSTPLHYALRINDLEVKYKIIKLLLKNSFIDVNYKYRPGNLKITALNYAIKFYCRISTKNKNNYEKNQIMKNILLLMIDKIKNTKLKIKIINNIDNKDELINNFISSSLLFKFNQSTGIFERSNKKSGISKKSVTNGTKKHFKYKKLPKDQKEKIDKKVDKKRLKQLEKFEYKKNKKARSKRKKRGESKKGVYF
jgi:hypothetical protein